MLGKVAIISGASRGIGFEISKRFLLDGINISICSRNKKCLVKAKKELEKFNIKKKIILISKTDISNKADVQKLIKKTFKKFKKINIIVNNAGVYGPKGYIETINISNWEKAISINLMGALYLSYYGIPILKKNKYSKIIQLSGGGATNPTPYISSYGASKAAVVRLMETISIEVKKFKIDVNSVAPGPINTRMLDEILQSGSKIVGKEIYRKALKQNKEGGSSIKPCLELISFLASNRSNGITGKLISALWDNWSKWPKHLKKLSNKDVYTLRRTVGRSAGFKLGDK
jgi:NAD(P)-dependent dehydrogenase (short-subunit alcohol dehydrogenase family)